MTDRDHFAAAAFAGLLAQGDDGSFSEESYAVAAYRWADALLRVRDSQTADNTIHDAAPAARARTDADSARTDKAAPRPGAGTGDTPATNPKPKEKLAEVSDGSYQKTDENRGNCDTCRAEVDRLRDAIRRLADQDATLSVQDGNVTVTTDATLTPEERDAVETAALEADAHQHTQRAATLRGLLERTRAALVAVAMQDGTLSVSDGRLFVNCDGAEQPAFDYAPPAQLGSEPETR